MRYFSPVLHIKQHHPMNGLVFGMMVVIPFWVVVAGAVALLG